MARQERPLTGRPVHPSSEEARRYEACLLHLQHMLNDEDMPFNVAAARALVSQVLQGSDYIAPDAGEGEH